MNQEYLEDLGRQAGELKLISGVLSVIPEVFFAVTFVLELRSYQQEITLFVHTMGQCQHET